MPPTNKVFNRTKRLSNGRQPRCRSKCVPPTSTQMTSLSFAPKQAFLCWNFKCGKSSGGATKAIVGEADARVFSGSDSAGHTQPVINGFAWNLSGKNYLAAINISHPPKSSDFEILNQGIQEQPHHFMLVD